MYPRVYPFLMSVLGKDGQWVVAECQKVFLYETDVDILLGAGVLVEFELVAVANINALMRQSLVRGRGWYNRQSPDILGSQQDGPGSAGRITMARLSAGTQSGPRANAWG